MFVAPEPEDQLPGRVIRLRAVGDVRHLEVTRSREGVEARGNPPFAGQRIRLRKLECPRPRKLHVPGPDPEAVRSGLAVNAEPDRTGANYRRAARSIAEEVDARRN